MTLLIAAGAFFVRSTLATCDCDVPALFAPLLAEVPPVERFSTGAGLSSSLTPEAQPARTAEVRAARRVRRVAFIGDSWSCCRREKMRRPLRQRPYGPH